ncbi:thiamine-phosphate pyrophosphorylase [Haloferax mucosum ATCC BAA-1512]|uniref:Thiamine-phosphate synthase n=1 Tax=Haloferax mucosum ATCC BAA-1512 TaxID=662479 RepID=M0IBH2_9EURY|nr:thiamine phosphate synthase [Haloferax mucosum]ELZ94101.1 thiamine-phosphate pyrophosphorylase [Haloferax mucosum ATCC BAA-1512]
MGTYLVTQSDRSDGRTTTDVVRAAVRGGVDMVQLREKHASARERYEIGREIREVTADAGVSFVVNDRVDIARAIDADGVHLGDDDVPVSVAREQLGPDAIVGRSVSTVAGANAAEDAGADYLGVGAVFSTATKETTPDQSEIGVKRIASVADAVSIPLVGIGGITPSNAPEVVAAGADGVAVVTAITAADDPETATRRLASAVSDGRDRR